MDSRRGRGHGHAVRRVQWGRRSPLSSGARSPPPALPSPSHGSAPASGKEVGISPLRAQPEPMAAAASVGSRWHVIWP